MLNMKTYELHGHCRGKKHSRTYRSWASMKTRCLNTNHPKYPCYGGRGIKICERWMAFENFLSDMGERPEGTSLDRINNDGNYEPGNCRWANSVVQGRTARWRKPSK